MKLNSRDLTRAFSDFAPIAQKPRRANEKDSEMRREVSAKHRKNKTKSFTRETLRRSEF